MRQSYSPEVEQGRERFDPQFATAPGDRCGAFRLYCPLTGEDLTIIAGDGADWQEIGLRLIPRRNRGR